jgi:hypothetical protein
MFFPKSSAASQGSGPGGLDEESRLELITPAVADLSRQQCYVDADRPSTSQVLRVIDFDVRIFRPRNSTQVSEDYYAADLAFRLSSGSSDDLRVVCRFPWAAIDPSLLERAKRVLSNQFEIRRSEDQPQAMR